MAIYLMGWPRDPECLTAAQLEALLSADVLVADEGWFPAGRERFVDAGAEWLSAAPGDEAVRVAVEESRRMAVVRVVPAHRLVDTWRTEAAAHYRVLPGMRPLDVQLACWGLPAGLLASDGWSADDDASGVRWATDAAPPSEGEGEWEWARADGSTGRGPLPGGEAVLARRVTPNGSSVAPPRVLILRADGQAERLAAAARQAGFEPVAAPIIGIESPDWTEADRHFRALRRYDWVVFTSQNGVQAFFDRMRYLRIDVRRLSGHLAAVGQETARQLAELCLSVELAPSGEAGQEGLLAAFEQTGRLAGKSVLLAVGNRRGPILSAGLRALGAIVDEAVVYRTVPRPLDARVARDLESDSFRAVFFTSGSTAQFLAAALSREGRSALRRVVRVAIGKSTAAVMEGLGFPASVVAARPDPDAMVQALQDHLARQGQMTTPR